MERRIEVRTKDIFKDVGGQSLAKRIKEELLLDVGPCRYVDVYNLSSDLSEDEMEILGNEVFSDAVSQDFSFKQPLFKDLWRLEVGMLPGVTDNIGKTASRALRDRLGKEIEVFHSRLYAIDADLDEAKCHKILYLIFNKLVEKGMIHKPDDIPEPYTPLVNIIKEPTVEKISLRMSEKRFRELVKTRLLALNIDEFQAIKSYFQG